jgi:hypothetical protein
MPDDAPPSMLHSLRRLWAQGAGALAVRNPLLFAREKKNTRTGGPDDDEDDELRRLMPILAMVIVIAVVFG